MQLDAWGSTDAGTAQIRVVEAQGPYQERDTVLHELLHAALLVMGKGREEEIVSALSPVLLDVLRSNPELVAYLVDETLDTT